MRKKKAWIAFFVAHGVLTRKIDKILEAQGLPSLDVYDVLLALEEAPGRRMRMSDLAEAVVLSRSGITRLVDRLEKDGYIERMACKNDRRSLYAAITEAGLQIRAQTWPAFKLAIEEFFADKMTNEEAEVIASVFFRMLDGVRFHGVKHCCNEHYAMAEVPPC